LYYPSDDKQSCSIDFYKLCFSGLVSNRGHYRYPILYITKLNLFRQESERLFTKS
jgi:hypothetical protein